MINCLCEEHKGELKSSSLDELKTRLQSEKDELAIDEAELKSFEGFRDRIKSRLSEHQQFELERMLTVFDNAIRAQNLIIKIIEHEINERNRFDENHEL